MVSHYKDHINQPTNQLDISSFQFHQTPIGLLLKISLRTRHTVFPLFCSRKKRGKSLRTASGLTGLFVMPSHDFFIGELTTENVQRTAWVVSTVNLLRLGEKRHQSKFAHLAGLEKSHLSSTAGNPTIKKSINQSYTNIQISFQHRLQGDM